MPLSTTAGAQPASPSWPALPFHDWEDTCGTLHLWSQIFYAYAYPEPDGFKTAQVRPYAASCNLAVGEFTLPYDAVREAPQPDAVLPDFFQSTYEAAEPGKWRRNELEYEGPQPKRTGI